MKRLSIFILLISLVCLVGLLTACDKQAADPCAEGHTAVTDAAVPATCTETGLTEGSHCSICNKSLIAQERVALLPHTEGAWVNQISATCTQAGVKQRSCTVCKTVLETQATASTGHTLSNWSVKEAATCQRTGVETNFCLICNEPQTRTTDRLAHTAGGWVLDIPATCTQTGARHKSCTVCGEVAQQESVSALGHLNESWTCIKEPTCISQGEEISGCTRCGEHQSRAIATVAHTNSDWITDVLPSCLAQGSRHKACTKCQSITATEILPCVGHNVPDSWTVTLMPTATTAGESIKRCTDCNMVAQTSANRLEYGSAVALAENTSVALIGYSVIYKQPAATNDCFAAHLTRLCTALKGATGGTYTAKIDSNTRITAKEILIGRTDRPESEQAFASLQGRAFTVRAVGDKIVIVGTDEALTLTALQYFINECLADSIMVTMSIDVTASDLTARPLAPTTGSNFVYVLDADLDRDPLHMYVSDSYNNKGYSGDGRDHAVYMFEKLISQISTRSSLALNAFPAITDTTTDFANGYEVLFGEIDRAESRAFRDKLAANEYGFCIWGKKVIITAHTDVGLERALDAFLAFYDYLLSTTNGVLPQGYAYVDAVTDKGWITDFPTPDGVTIENAQNNNDNSIQIIYTGESATPAGYLAYCRKLEDAGYTIVQKNDNPGNTGNYFRLYRHTENSHVLYVAYNAFAAQEDYAKVYEEEAVQFGDFIHYSVVNSGKPATQYPMRTYKKCIRVVSAPLDTAYLPDETILTQQSYTKICESSVTAMRLVGSSVGMGYILQLQDGRFVIVDGGNYIAANYDREILYATLTELHTKAYGTAPTKDNPIHIAAWLITHSHGDHYSNMNNVLAAYAKTGLIKMDYLIGNFPEISTIYPVGGDTTWMGNGQNIPKMQKYFTNAGLTAFKYVKAHTGMTLYFANLKMEILMTYEDHAPHRITNSNDTNTVTKWTITSENTDTTWTLLGDSCIYASRWMCAMWGGKYNANTTLYDGGYLSSDMVQLAHHGNIGCERAMYKTVQPTVVWFPHHASSYNSYTQNGTGNWTRSVDSYTVNTLPTVKYIIVSGISGNYTDSVTISFNADGIYFPSSDNPAWGIKYNKTTGAVTITNIAYNRSRYGTKVSNSPVIKK